MQVTDKGVYLMLAAESCHISGDCSAVFVGFFPAHHKNVMEFVGNAAFRMNIRRTFLAACIYTEAIVIIFGSVMSKLR